ncbi:hypothetical protein KC331_g7730 [Hortaea werneckii]|nr:hypothetical protein KC331_g7730 [Hortaea werneckii]KAI7712799.1 hypothetical protein KC353_g8019 [Hortaea werneckii]
MTTRWIENLSGPRPEKKDGDIDDDAEDPGKALKPEEQEERLAIKSDPIFRQSNLSVGVEDARIGQRAERLDISENGDYAYACLYNIISGARCI